MLLLLLTPKPNSLFISRCAHTVAALLGHFYVILLNLPKFQYYRISTFAERTLSEVEYQFLFYTYKYFLLPSADIKVLSSLPLFWRLCLFRPPPLTPGGMRDIPRYGVTRYPVSAPYQNGANQHPKTVFGGCNLLDLLQ